MSASASAEVKVKFMLDKLGLAFALASLLLGAVLLCDAVSVSDVSQTAKVIGGALFFALGLVTIFLLMKDWWGWRKHEKNAARSAPDWPSQD
ncbi:MAG: hypothetical protein DMG39_08375 [Acidobacteria bacterium]|nr:MAG: hypothetical protein DMG39_08375 [Acidobacteriota bacterium]